MASITIRNLDDDVKTRLRRARGLRERSCSMDRGGSSLILADAVGRRGGVSRKGWGRRFTRTVQASYVSVVSDRGAPASVSPSRDNAGATRFDSPAALPWSAGQCAFAVRRADPPCRRIDRPTVDGRLSGDLGHEGTDLLIAATALEHGLTVVTRNVRHFEPTGVPLLDPSDAGASVSREPNP